MTPPYPPVPWRSSAAAGAALGLLRQPPLAVLLQIPDWGSACRKPLVAILVKSGDAALPPSWQRCPYGVKTESPPPWLESYARGERGCKQEPRAEMLHSGYLPVIQAAILAKGQELVPVLPSFARAGFMKSP